MTALIEIDVGSRRFVCNLLILGVERKTLYGYRFSFVVWTEPIVNNNKKFDPVFNERLYGAGASSTE